MAISTSKAIVFSLLLSTLVLQLVQAQEADPPTAATSPISSPPSGKIDCGAACIGRCSLSSRQNLCQRACGTCCKRCQCVPPGTSGNYDACPCYASLTTRDNKPKCP